MSRVYLLGEGGEFRASRQMLGRFPGTNGGAKALPGTGRGRVTGPCSPPAGSSAPFPAAVTEGSQSPVAVPASQAVPARGTVPTAPRLSTETRRSTVAGAMSRTLSSIGSKPKTSDRRPTSSCRFGQWGQTVRPSEFGRAVPGHAPLPVQKNGLESCPWANAQSGFAAEGGGAVGALPGESRLVAAEVPVGRGPPVDGAAQVQVSTRPRGAGRSGRSPAR